MMPKRSVVYLTWQLGPHIQIVMGCREDREHASWSLLVMDGPTVSLTWEEAQVILAQGPPDHIE